MQELKVIEILKRFMSMPYYSENIPTDTETIEAIKELEEYEQNFKQKEFDYRTKCQNILSSEKLAVSESDSCDNCLFKDIHECVECLTCKRFWGDNFELKKWQPTRQNEVLK